MLVACDPGNDGQSAAASVEAQQPEEVAPKLAELEVSGFQARTIEFNNCTIKHVIDVIVQSAPVPDIV